MIASELVAMIRRDYLQPTGRERRNKLAVTCDDDDTELTLTYAVNNINEGSVLGIGLEDLYVFAVSPSSAPTVTVERGYGGTRAAAHTSGAPILVNPQWSNAQIVRAVNAELGSWVGNGIFQMKTVELTSAAVEQSYPLPVTDLVQAYTLHVDATGPENAWPEIRHSDFQIVKHAETDDFPTGFALRLYGYTDPSVPLRLTYKAPFGEVGDLDDDLVSDVGAPATAMDLLALGASLRLLVGTEVERNRLDSQPDTRRAQEVPATARVQALTPFRQQHARRLNEERMAFARKYPPRSGM